MSSNIYINHATFISKIHLRLLRSAFCHYIKLFEVDPALKLYFLFYFSVSMFLITIPCIHFQLDFVKSAETFRISEYKNNSSTYIIVPLFFYILFTAKVE